MSEFITLPPAKYENLQPCCLREDGLFEAERVRGHMTMRVCRSCGRRHFTMEAEAGVLQMLRHLRMKAEPGRFGTRR